VDDELRHGKRGDEPRTHLVRHELDLLAEARMLGDLGPTGEAKYQELCQIERELLGRYVAA